MLKFLPPSLALTAVLGGTNLSETEAARVRFFRRQYRSYDTALTALNSLFSLETDGLDYDLYARSFCSEQQGLPPYMRHTYLNIMKGECIKRTGSANALYRSLRSAFLRQESNGKRSSYSDRFILHYLFMNQHKLYTHKPFDLSKVSHSHPSFDTVSYALSHFYVDAAYGAVRLSPALVSHLENKAIEARSPLQKIQLCLLAGLYSNSAIFRSKPSEWVSDITTLYEEGKTRLCREYIKALLPSESGILMHAIKLEPTFPYAAEIALYTQVQLLTVGGDATQAEFNTALRSKKHDAQVLKKFLLHELFELPDQISIGFMLHQRRIDRAEGRRHLDLQISKLNLHTPIVIQRSLALLNVGYEEKAVLRALLDVYDRQYAIDGTGVGRRPYLEMADQVLYEIFRHCGVPLSDLKLEFDNDPVKQDRNLNRLLRALTEQNPDIRSDPYQETGHFVPNRLASVPNDRVSIAIQAVSALLDLASNPRVVDFSELATGLLTARYRRFRSHKSVEKDMHTLRSIVEAKQGGLSASKDLEACKIEAFSSSLRIYHLMRDGA